MSVYILISRNSTNSRLETILGAYSSWQRGWSAFVQRWKKGGWPFQKGIIHHSSIEHFSLMIADVSLKAKSVRIYTNDFILVDIVKLEVDAAVS